MNSRKKTALEHCRKEIAPVGSDLHYALRFTPKNQHPTILAILRFYHDIVYLIFTAKEQSVTEAKLNWWGDELTKMHQRKSGHPTLQLLATLSDQPSFTTHLLQLLNAISDGLSNFSFARFDDVCLHLKRTIGLRELMIQDLLGHDKHHEATIDLAISLGLLDIIHHFYTYAKKHFIPISQEDLSNLHLEGLFNNLSSTPENLKILLKKYHETAKGLFVKASAIVKEEPTFKNILLRNKLALATVEAIAADGYCVLEQQTTITPLKKLAIAWLG